MIAHVLIAILLVLLAGVIPLWPYSRRWGYAPAAGTATLVLVLMLLLKYDVL